MQQLGMTMMSMTIAAPPKRQQANHLSGGGLMRTSTINDMDPTWDKVYNGCVIYSTIINLPDVMVSLITGFKTKEVQKATLQYHLVSAMLFAWPKGKSMEGFWQ
jgi:hypothetical protein